MSDVTMQVPKTEKRAAIVGTASTWKYTPWGDKDLHICGLNDGYALGWRKGWPGLPKVDAWYDLHPFSQMSFQPKQQRAVSAFQVPVGAYLRPEGHLDWLRSQTFPVYVNEKPAGWPAHVQTFPRADLEKKYGTYFSSTPAWMLVHLIEQGFTTIEIYGIHLATEWEYVSQRPNFEFLLGIAAAKGCKIVLPRQCPLLKSKHVYAYEPKHDLPLREIEIRMAKIKQEGQHFRTQLAACKFYEVGRKADLTARLQVLELELADAKHALQRTQQIVAA